jgi:hypothetical protein
MFEKLTKRFDQVAKAMNRLSKLKLTGQLTELKVPDGFLKVKMSGEITELKVPEELLKVKTTGEMTKLEVPDKLLKLKMAGDFKKIKVPEVIISLQADLSLLMNLSLDVICRLVIPSVPKVLWPNNILFVFVQFVIIDEISWLRRFGQENQQDVYSRVIVHEVVETQLLLEAPPKPLLLEGPEVQLLLEAPKTTDLQSKIFGFLKKTFDKLNFKGVFDTVSSKIMGTMKSTFSKLSPKNFKNSIKDSWKKNSTNQLKMPGFMNTDNAKSVISSTMGAGMKQQQTKGAFIARAGNAQLGGAIYDQVAKQALQFGQNPDDALSSALSFTNTTMDPNKITEMNKLAMRLAQMNPEKGLEGAASSMMDLFKGESSSMVDDFGMGESSVEASAALKAGKAGDINGFIKGMDELLNKRNMTEQAFEGMMKSPAAQWGKAVDSFKFNLGLVGQMGLEAFGPLITMITEAFDSGKFTPFFTFFGKGLYVIVTLISWLAEGFMGVLGFLGANLPLIAGLIASGLVVALWNVLPPLFAMIPPILTQVGAWFMANLPIFLIIGAIALLLFILQKLGVSAGQIVGFITGVFYTFFAYIKNSIAYFWNILISLKEFLINVFKDPSYAIKKLLYDLAQNVAGFFGSVINGIVDKLNVLLKAAEKIGIKVPLIPEVEVDKWLEQLKPTSTKDVVDLSNEKMQFENLGDAFDNGFNKGEKLMDGLSSMKNPFSLDTKYDGAIPPIDNIKKVEEVGAVKDTVEVSGEDLATMRELAEMKNIQNFVQMTPSVNVQTGDVRQESDINTIVARIEQVLTEQIVSSAQGVYGT